MTQKIFFLKVNHPFKNYLFFLAINQLHDKEKKYILTLIKDNKIKMD